jgi:hypothetical protein
LARCRTVPAAARQEQRGRPADAANKRHVNKLGQAWPLPCRGFHCVGSGYFIQSSVGRDDLGRTSRPGGRRPRFSCLASPRSCRGPHAPGGDVVNAATIQGENKVISVSTGHGVRATRESSGCVQPQLAGCAIVLARATIRSRLGTSLSKNAARATSLDPASDRSDQDRLVKRPGNIPAYAACRTGGSPSHHFGRTANPKIRPYSKNPPYSPRRVNPATDRMRSTNAQIWISHFRHAADRIASGR